MQAVIEQKGISTGNVQQGSAPQDVLDFREGHRFRVDQIHGGQVFKRDLGEVQPALREKGCQRQVGNPGLWPVLQIWAAGLDNVSKIVVTGGGEEMQFYNQSPFSMEKIVMLSTLFQSFHDVRKNAHWCYRSPQ